MTSSDAQVLFVDDDDALRTVASALLEQAGLRCLTADSTEGAIALLETKPVDVVVTDLRMPGMGGMALVQRVARDWPDVPVIVLTAHGTVALAVEAMKAGASDFLLKPFEREEVLLVVRKALAAGERRSARLVGPERAAFGLVGGSPHLRELRTLVRKAANSNATVLIRGETGTGKGVVARAVHEQGARRSRPFVTCQPAALPDALLESELFGHERGAFTGAGAKKPGRVELAAHGTLFLDEIGDVPLATQVKLLRILQDKEFERVGGTETLKVNVRFIAATHRPLEQLVESGRFREDLFYRLTVIPTEVPPLRARPDDIEALALHFAALAATANERANVELERSATELLRGQPWPGNVRQLENFVERLVVLSDAPRITRADVERELVRDAASASVQPREQRLQLERASILEALARAGNNRSLAARLLGVSRRTLYNKLEEFGLSPSADVQTLGERNPSSQ